MPAKVLAIVAMMLLAAVYPLPYGFYTFLRLVVCASSGFAAYTGLVADKKRLWPWAAVGVALLFNPMIPVHLSKGTWAGIDVAAAVFFFALAYMRVRSDPATDS